MFQRIESTRALRDMVTNLRQALSSRSVIDQAKGILMARHGYDADEAFTALSELSQRENIKVRDLAVLLTEEVRHGGTVAGFASVRPRVRQVTLIRPPPRRQPVSVKLAIIYYSSTGTVDTMARRAASTAEKAGAEVRLRHVEELAPDDVVDWVAGVARARRRHGRTSRRATPDDIVWADAVLFGSPTRFGNVASQLKQYLDTLGPQWGEGKLADKVYAGFTAAKTDHGGQESTLLALYNTIYHFGGILVPPGYTDPVKFEDGNPYGVSHGTGADGDVRSATSRRPPSTTSSSGSSTSPADSPGRAERHVRGSRDRPDHHRHPGHGSTACPGAAGTGWW